MSLFFGPSKEPTDGIVEKATSEDQTTENWEVIINICDVIKAKPQYVKSMLVSLKKRLNHRDPHVIMLALSLLDSLWSNCGNDFRHGVCSKDFIPELEAKCKSSTRQIGEKSRLMVKKWAETEAKSDDSLGLIRSLYKTLLIDGFSFESSEPKKKTVAFSNDPNVVTSQEEEDAVAAAIAASLKDAPPERSNGKSTNSSSLYPSAGTMNGGGGGSRSTPSAPSLSLASVSIGTGKGFVYPALTASPEPATIFSPLSRNTKGATKIIRGRKIFSTIKELENDSSDRTIVEEDEDVFTQSTGGRRVWALYDFEAAEDNELSFRSGDVIVVTDDSNANWWRGRNETAGGEGLFPSSFATMNKDEIAGQKEATTAAPVAAAPVARIDEEQLMRCIALLEDCDPSGAITDPPELASIEAASVAQAPLIDAALASVDRQTNELAQLDVKIRNVLALYDNAVQAAAAAAQSMYGVPPMGYGQQQPPQSMHHSAMGAQQPPPPPGGYPPQQQYSQYAQMPSVHSLPPQPQQPQYGMPQQGQQQYMAQPQYAMGGGQQTVADPAQPHYQQPQQSMAQGNYAMQAPMSQQQQQEWAAYHQQQAQYQAHAAAHAAPPSSGAYPAQMGGYAAPQQAPPHSQPY